MGTGISVTHRSVGNDILVMRILQIIQDNLPWWMPFKSRIIARLFRAILDDQIVRTCT